MNEQEWMEKLKQEGVTNLSILIGEPNGIKEKHTHDVHTVHVILNGELTITDDKGKKIFNPGDRVDFPAGTIHVASYGSNGCKMIVGVKE